MRIAPAAFLEVFELDEYVPPGLTREDRIDRVGRIPVRSVAGEARRGLLADGCIVLSVHRSCRANRDESQQDPFHSQCQNKRGHPASAEWPRVSLEAATSSSFLRAR